MLYPEAIFEGFLCGDPELRKTRNGTSVCSFSVACKRTPEKDAQTDFLDCIAWKQTAEHISRHFNKGDLAVFRCSIQTRIWKARDNTSRKSIDFVVLSVTKGALPPKRESGSPKKRDVEDKKDLIQDEIPDGWEVLAAGSEDLPY